MTLYIKQWRKARGLSQGELSALCGITDISNIERHGTSRESSIRKIAEALRITREQLYVTPEVTPKADGLSIDIAPLLVNPHASFNGQLIPEPVKRLFYEYVKLMMETLPEIQTVKLPS